MAGTRSERTSLECCPPHLVHFLTATFPFQPRRIVADDRVADTRRRMSIERGPIVYCAEWPDVDKGMALEVAGLGSGGSG